MNSSRNIQFSRRTLMRAAGSTLLLPTFLKHAFAQTAVTRPNLVLMMQTNGTHQASYWPTGTAWTSDILKGLLTDPVVGPKVTLIKNINLNKQGSPSGNGHDWGWHGLYSGFDNNGLNNGGPSLDQILIGKLQFSNPFKNIHCGVIAENHSLINPGRASFSYATPTLQVPCETDIYALYTKVFGAVPATPAPAAATGTAANTAAVTAATLRLAQRKSVLDAVASDLMTLEGRLGASERMKVDSHLTAVRDFENRLTGTLTTGGGGPVSRPANCSTMKPSMAGVPLTTQANEANANTLMHLFMEFIGNALACNMVGVLTFQFGRGGGHFHYQWLNLPGMPADFHDMAAHKDNGSDTTAASLMVGVGQYYALLLTELGQKLASFPQGDGKTALDNSLVVWGNELATGPHGINGSPIAFLGGAAGKLKRTGYMVDSGTQIHQRLGTTISNIMGDPIAGFGWVPNSGPFVGLDLAV